MDNLSHSHDMLSSYYSASGHPSFSVGATGDVMSESTRAAHSIRTDARLRECVRDIKHTHGGD
jgi:hypothetical protein